MVERGGSKRLSAIPKMVGSRGVLDGLLDKLARRRLAATTITNASESLAKYLWFRHRRSRRRVDNHIRRRYHRAHFAQKSRMRWPPSASAGALIAPPAGTQPQSRNWGLVETAPFKSECHRGNR